MAGKDANESCKECHNPGVVETKITEFEFSKHEYGEAAFEEAGNTGCTPCHTSGCIPVCLSKQYSFNFHSCSAQANIEMIILYSDNSALGEFTCFTCHSNLHTTYTGADFQPLTRTAPVAMTMWKGTKTINLTSGWRIK